MAIELAKIVGAVAEPFIKKVGGHPAPPANLERGKEVVLGQPESNGTEDEPEHGYSELHEKSVVAALDGIEEGAVPIGELYADPVLREGEQDDGAEQQASDPFFLRAPEGADQTKEEAGLGTE